ncbi:MAG: LPS assembly protein LptD, partial [Sphingomonadales bacterium]
GLVLAAEVRKHLGFGIIQSEGSITYTDIPDTFGKDTGSNGIRGHIFANGTFNHSENLRTQVQFQLTSDDTYLKRYGFSRVDTLKSELLTELFKGRSYYSLRALWFQGLRAEDVQGLTAFALPLINLNLVSEPDRIGGVFNIQFNALALQRTDGMDSSRATIRGSYVIPYTTRHGQILKLGVHFRGDVYNISNSNRPDFNFFRGQDGSYSRFLPHLTASFEWPFVKTGKRTQQILTPIVTFVAAPTGGNPVGISNEDSRAFELSDSNILSGNRMPGFDLWESGSRFNFGFKWLIISKNFTIDTFFGESYRFAAKSTDPDDIRFAPGSGLSTSLSDLVTRVDITIKGKIRISNRMRFDESSFKVRRNEIDANIYIQNAMFGIGYYKLNRGLQIQGLENREEIRIYGQYSFKTNWKVFGDITRNLTTTGATVFQGIGISYSDDCVELSVAWRKSFTTDREISPGTSILFRLRLKHLG